MRFERLHRFSLETLLSWGFGLPIVSAVLTVASVLAVGHVINTAFDEYEHQDMPMALFASNGHNDWLRVRRYEEHFLLAPGAAIKIADAKARYISLWQSHLDNIRAGLKKIRGVAGANDQAIADALPGIEALLARYETNFGAVVESVVRLGDNDEGLEGEMIAKTRVAEAAFAKANLPALTEHLMTLRRLQEDFILTGKQQYATGFADEVAGVDHWSATPLNAAQQQLLQGLVKDYAALFNQYLAAARDLDAKKQEYTKAGRHLDADFDQLQLAALQNASDGLYRAERRVGIAKAIIIFGSALFGIAIIVIAFFVTGKIRLATHRIIGFAAHLAAGKLETRLNQIDSGEFGTLETALNTMADRLQLTDDSMTRHTHSLVEHNQRIALLSEMTGLLQIVVSMEEATEVVLRHMAALGIGIGGGVYLYKESGNYLDILARWGEPVLLDSFSPDECWALRRGLSYGTAGPSTDRSAVLVCPHAAHGGHAHPYLCLPMIGQGGALGLVHVVFSDQQTAGEEEIGFARRITEQLSLALANVKLRETLREQSLSDPLTKLFNRRYLQISLDREFARAAREKRPIAILMLDVDHFKKFNDTHGHEAGDTALRQLGRVLKGNCRGADLACRYGGEEFTVVLPDTGDAGAVGWATRLMEIVRKMEINLHGARLPTLTVSIGIACYPKHGEDAQTVLHSADLALYQAKHAGRDRCVVKEVDDELAGQNRAQEKSSGDHQPK